MPNGRILQLPLRVAELCADGTSYSGLGWVMDAGKIFTRVQRGSSDTQTQDVLSGGNRQDELAK